MKDPELGPLFEIGLGNDLGRICQGIQDICWHNQKGKACIDAHARFSVHGAAVDTKYIDYTL
jgi:hypothetical protein